MKLLKYPFWICYRIWFYLLMAIPIFALFPLLLLSISREKWYPYFFKLAQFWAWFVLVGMGYQVKRFREEQLVPGKSYMLIANHTSMTDIMLMLVSVNNPFVFVGKYELAKIPVFGFFYKRTCILVDRSSSKSRHRVFEMAHARLKNGLSICIFPEGGVPEAHVVLDDFKDGAFRLAIEHHIDVVPMVFPDNKKRFGWDFFSGSPGVMRSYILPFISTQACEASNKLHSKELKLHARAVILQELIKRENL